MPGGKTNGRVESANQKELESDLKAVHLCKGTQHEPEKLFTLVETGKT